MHVVIDTVVISRITRRPRRGSQLRTETVLDPLIRKRKLTIVVDNALALIDEWRKTAGDEPVKRIIESWDTRAFHIVAPGRFDPQISRQLSRLKFKDTVDRLVVRIALGVAPQERHICSGDSDFWNPSSKQSVGNRSAVVASLLREELDIDIHTLPELLDLLSAE